MGARTSNLLITGRPGVGKTTVVVRAIERLHGVGLAGFLTEEIRDRGGRVGFAAETLAGERRVMAHVEIASRQRVGRYGVDVSAVEEIVRLVEADESAAQAFLIDEIGKMELCSRRFTALIERLLNDPRPLVASIALKGPGLVATARRRPDVELWQVDLGNRDAMPREVAQWIRVRLGV